MQQISLDFEPVHTCKTSQLNRNCFVTNKAEKESNQITAAQNENGKFSYLSRPVSGPTSQMSFCKSLNLGCLESLASAKTTPSQVLSVAPADFNLLNAYFLPKLKHCKKFEITAFFYINLTGILVI
jgi:hypothetical protein